MILKCNETEGSKMLVELSVLFNYKAFEIFVLEPSLFSPIILWHGRKLTLATSPVDVREPVLGAIKAHFFIIKNHTKSEAPFF